MVQLKQRIQHWWMSWVEQLFPYSMRSPYAQFLADGAHTLIFESEPVRDSKKVVDFGAFTGHSTSEVLKISQAEIFAVEPMPDYAESLKIRFRNEPRVFILSAMLGMDRGQAEFFVEGDKSGAWAKGEPRVVTVAPVSLLGNFLDTQNSVALINIEGGEYSLLDLLDTTNLLARFRTLYIQFHRISNSSEPAREAAQQQLLKTHDLIWEYPFVWERWDRRVSDELEPLG